ncbi:MAG: polyphosphate kinase 1 [Acetanaerobacterium sp.]
MSIRHHRKENRAMREPKLYINRELSWLRFNERVLEEARCTTTPLYERLRFLSIFASNLDEFYMVRIGSLLDRSLLSENMADNKTGMKPEEQIRAANHVVKKLYPVRDGAFFDILEGLAEVDACHRVTMAELDGGNRRVVKSYFDTEVLPLLSPQIIDIKHPFPHLENRQLHIAVRLKSKERTLYGIVALPHQLERLYRLPGSKGSFLLLEDIVLHYAEAIFEIYATEAKAVFRITRNADIELGESLFDEGIEYREMMKEMLKKRRRLSPVRLEISDGTDEGLRGFFLGKLGLSKGSCFECRSPLDLGFVAQLDSIITPKDQGTLLYAPLNSQWPASLARENLSLQLARKEVLLCYPYHSMRPLIDVLREAAKDPSVVSVKMTLYRVSSQSKVVQYLCAAAESGKDIVVIVELRARFDEQNNIEWATMMENAGCKILYGIEDYKVHGKLVLITRRTHGRPQHLVNISTGNYNESTARVYTDYSFFTTDPAICSDAVLFFRNMEIGNLYGNYRKLLIAPSNMKSRILDLISQEIAKANEGQPARIVAKMNSLTDKDLIDKLIDASQANVKITLIIRGICCLRPGLADYTDNIEVRSIVGRLLEHARVLRFGEGDGAKLYMGSADLMTRNTERRVEILTPIENPALARQITDMLEAQMRDNVKARVLLSDGTYIPVQTDEPPLDSQLYCFEQAYLQAENTLAQRPKPANDLVSAWIKRIKRCWQAVRGKKG